jgi:hypothetical protein
LAHLRRAFETCAADPSPKSQAAVGKLVIQMATLQGEVTRKSEVEHRGSAERVDIHLRVSFAAGECTDFAV